MPALIELLGGTLPALALLGACLGWAFATGAINVWAATFGKVLDWLAGILPGAVHIAGRTILPDLAGAVRAANNGVQDYFKIWRKGAEIEIALSIHALKLVWQAQAEAADWIARETAATFDHLVHIRVPKVVRYAVPFALTPLILRKIVAAVLPLIRARITSVYRVITHDVIHTTTRIVVKSAAVAIPGVRGLPGLRREVTGLTRRFWRINARLRKVEALFGAAAFAAVLANALGVGTRCVRSGNIGRTARRICGMDGSLLDSLLADGLAILGVVSVVEFAEALLEIEDEAVKVMSGLIKEWPS